MAEIMGNWPSGHGQITKIWPSDRCGGKNIPAAMQFGYNLREFGGYLGNVGGNRTYIITARRITSGEPLN